MDLSNLLTLNINLIYALLGIVGLIALNVIFGIALSLKDKSFNIEKLPQFINTEITAYLLGLTALVGASQIDFATLLTATGGTIANLGFTGMAITALGTYGTRLLVDLGKKFSILFGIGTPIE